MRHPTKGDKARVVWTVMFDVYPVNGRKDIIVRNGFLDEDFLTKKELKLIDKIVQKHHSEINYGIRSSEIDDLTED